MTNIVTLGKCYFPSEQILNDEQKKFYKEVELSLKNLKYIDIGGNIGYVFIYLYKLIDCWNKAGYEKVFEDLVYISEMYKKEEALSSYALAWAHDCLLGLEEYETYLNFTEQNRVYGTATHRCNLRLNVARHIKQDADPIDIVLMVGGRTSKFIKANESLYKSNLINVLDEFIEQSEFSNWFEVFDSWLPNNTQYEHYLFAGSANSNRAILNFKVKAFYSAYDQLYIIKELIKKAENLARKDLGVPAIGEGWISETLLYKSILDAFPETKVIQHGRPIWLGRQHLDIWLPHWNIAVEYHGRQHFEAVDYFGGAEAFQQTQQRDNRKIRLCENNNVNLIIATEDNSHEDIIARIRSIKRR